MCYFKRYGTIINNITYKKWSFKCKFYNLKNKISLHFYSLEIYKKITKLR